MSKKTKNILTTVLGILFGLGDFALYFASRLGLIEPVGIVEIVTIAALSILLIQAWNGPLQGFVTKVLNLK